MSSTFSLACAASLALAGLLSCAASAEEAPAVNRERVLTLVQQLSEESFDRREDAGRALRELGEDCWPLLKPFMKSPDPELAARVGRLGQDLAVMDRTEQAAAQGWLAMLRDRKNEFERARGLDGLLALGPGSIRMLREELSSRNAHPVLTVSLDRPSGLVAEQVTLKAEWVNKGSGTCWAVRGTHSIRLNGVFQNRFGHTRPKNKRLIRGGSGGRGCGGFNDGYYNPIRAFYGFTSGEVMKESEASLTLSQTGVYTFRAEGSVGDARVIRPRIPGDLHTIALEVGQAMPPNLRNQKQERTVYAWPDTEDADADHLLQMQIANICTVLVDGKRMLRLSPTFQAAEGEAVHLESGLPNYAWYAVVNADGVAMSYGAWAKVLCGANRTGAMRGQLIECEDKASWELQVPLPAMPGRYRIMLGYEVGLEKFEVINFPTVETDVENEGLMDAHPIIEKEWVEPDHGTAYLRGQLYSEIPDVVVPDGPKP